MNILCEHTNEHTPHTCGVSCRYEIVFKKLKITGLHQKYKNIFDLSLHIVLNKVMTKLLKYFRLIWKLHKHHGIPKYL